MNNTNTPTQNTRGFMDLELETDSDGYISGAEFARQFHQYFEAKQKEPKEPRVESPTTAAFKALGFWK